MRTIFSRMNAFLPFNKTERIILAIVIGLHLLFLIGFQSSMKPDHDNDLDETRVMANLVSPEAAQTPPAPPPAAPPPKPKQEKKKAVKEKVSQTPAPTKAQQAAESPPTPQQSSSEAQTQSAAVAPSTSSGASGTPIQTDIGKLIVVYQPDADAYYPSFSKRSGEQGEVVVKLIIDEGGNVEDIALMRSSSFPRLDRAATEIGKRYRFKPYVVNGSPTRISTNLLIKFNLKN
ncbi:MAG: energy transducer TonB [Polynucleobacter sp. 24-46-87]|nr:MAG: energy transducer TonB [Polynucleobacter sp. 35-46-207]OYZ36170.1 MAG: energy transducer TonB [Polynucleobacter sp. 16-46-70]OZA03239.1 MAG: energy transducer TonB [Polynucleobacter sp. 24-46-87]OZA36126.1 MAG: energy transducer TonB [Polynucleobacter sp. 17-46-58]OZB40792.1 MAG: energy transducer TonB [Polynucleobacter sp. 39-45-136]QWE11146.1 energy transducer TonB [Polynucleobacter sp. es-EL-1]HQT20803.1 energy transducer TonB [Polynucleobacter sp.]